MGFGEAIKTVFSKYVVFEGRARRSEFWWWFLFVWLVSFVANFIDNLAGMHVYQVSTEAGTTWIPYSNGVGWIALIVSLALVLPTISVSVRRLHDTDRTGWWWWLNLVCCVGGIVLLVFYLLPSTPGSNRYGEQPQ